MAKISAIARIIRKFATITDCWSWVGSTAVTKPSPICWAMIEPATESAASVKRAVAPSTTPTMISWTISTITAVVEDRST